MSRIQIVIYRIEDERSGQKTELNALNITEVNSSQDLTAFLAELEPRTSSIGQQVARMLYAILWREVDNKRLAAARRSAIPRQETPAGNGKVCL